MKRCTPCSLVLPLLSLVGHLTTPPRCVGCGSSLLEEALGLRAADQLVLCDSCRAALPELAAPLCGHCGRQLISEVGRCLRCRQTESALTTVQGLYSYRDAAKGVVSSLKEAGEPRTARFLAEEFRRRGFLDPETALLVPIPASQRGRRRRGFDQSLLLARMLSMESGVPFARLLKRRGGGEQKRLDRAGRMANMEEQLYMPTGRRAPGRSWPDEIPPMAVTLVDDVVTTGATLETAAQLLLEAGVRRVRAVVIALD